MPKQTFYKNGGIPKPGDLIYQLGSDHKRRYGIVVEIWGVKGRPKVYWAHKGRTAKHLGIGLYLVARNEK